MLVHGQCLLPPKMSDFYRHVQLMTSHSKLYRQIVAGKTLKWPVMFEKEQLAS